MDNQQKPIHNEEPEPIGRTDPADEAGDTEGHSLQVAEFGRTMARDRAREAEQMARESRMREEAKGQKRGRSLFRR
jgi:hypothetical protein